MCRPSRTDEMRGATRGLASKWSSNIRSEGRLVCEVGCSYGFYVWEVKYTNRPTVQVPSVAVEASRSTRSNALGLGLHCGSAGCVENNSALGSPLKGCATLPEAQRRSAEVERSAQAECDKCLPSCSLLSREATEHTLGSVR